MNNDLGDANTLCGLLYAAIKERKHINEENTASDITEERFRELFEGIRSYLQPEYINKMIEFGDKKAELEKAIQKYDLVKDKAQEYINATEVVLQEVSHAIVCLHEDPRDFEDPNKWINCKYLIDKAEEAYKTAQKKIEELKN